MTEMSTSLATAVLLDPELDRDLQTRGFAVTPLLNATEVELLLEFYNGLTQPGDHGLTVEYMRPDRAAMRRIEEVTRSIWERRISSVFADHRVVMTTYVVKHPDERSPMMLHDDRTFVDVRCHRSTSLWIPLHDVGPTIPNGGLQVVPRSHLIGNDWSGHGTSDVVRPHEERLEAYRVDLEVPAGSAAVYDSRLLHGSQANHGPGLRIAVVCAVVPAAAPVVQVLGTEPGRCQLFEVDDRYFVDVHPPDAQVALAERGTLVDQFDVPTHLDWKHIVETIGPPPEPPSIGIAILSYHAASTIANVLERVPRTIEGAAVQVMVSDDASADETSRIAADSAPDILVTHHQHNLGNGGNQQWCLRWAIESGHDIVVVAHGDDQHPVEFIERLVAPILHGHADVVMGSRMLEPGAARRGGMPLVRRLGNRSLSTALNMLVGSNYSEWFSGFRAFRVDTLAMIDLDRLPTGFDFDPAILESLHDAGARIIEVPVPTHYGDEVSRVDLWRDGLRIFFGAALRRLSHLQKKE